MILRLNDRKCCFLNSMNVTIFNDLQNLLARTANWQIANYIQNNMNLIKYRKYFRRIEHQTSKLTPKLFNSVLDIDSQMVSTGC